MYCPYCNNNDLDKLTEEHVIPQCIGGDKRTVIKVCRKCNSEVGQAVDTALARHSGVRFIAMSSGRKTVHPKRQEYHESIATLKDGNKLTGIVYVQHVDDGFHFEFEPRGIQSDGYRWIRAEQAEGQRIPDDVKILNADSIESRSFEFKEGKDLGLEIAMLKIMLGIRYIDRGKPEISLGGYDAIRLSLRGTMHQSIAYNWIDPIDKLQYPCGNKEHLIWSGCPNGSEFIGGVSLFGRLSMEARISDFSAVVPNRSCLIPCVWRM